MAGSEGSAFGKYFLLKKIAAGGMGEIYLAKLKGPVGFEKLLVIKRILQHHVENEEFLDMFFAEARIAAQLTHSNIVQIYEMGEIEDAYFIAMEYVHGKSLRDVVDRARQMGDSVHPAHVVDVISKLCAGMSYAHNARDMSGDPLGIIHRDINPHNMIVSYSGDLKVIDFGIAKSEMSMHQTETGTIKGKFVYMSPEQSAAEKLDKRSDIFACGICLYETLTASNPFAKANVVLSLDAIQRKDPPPLADANPRLAPFDPIIRKALAKKVEDRYSDAIEMRDDLVALLSDGKVQPPPIPLAAYMHDLFEEQIEEEKRMIIETDSASTGQIAAMRAARRNDNRSGRGRAYEGEEDWDEDLAAHAAMVDLYDEPRSRAPFFILLLAIIAFTFVSSLVVVKVSRRPNLQANAASAGAAVAEPVAGNFQERPADEPAPKASAADKRVNKPKPKAKPKYKPKPKPKPGKKDARAPPPPKPDPTPPPPPAVPAGPQYGAIFISTNPPIAVSHRGRSGQTFKLKSSSGSFTFGKEGVAGKFYIKVGYRVADGKMTLTSVKSEPWAIVNKNGIGQGKTPLGNVVAGTNAKLDFLNPKEGLRLKVNLRYSP